MRTFFNTVFDTYDGFQKDRTSPNLSDLVPTVAVILFLIQYFLLRKFPTNYPPCFSFNYCLFHTVWTMSQDRNFNNFFKIDLSEFLVQSFSAYKLNKLIIKKYVCENVAYSDELSLHLHL